MPIQIYWKFYLKNWKFSDNNSDTFLISAQNIDCGYSLEPPWQGGSNEYPQSMVLSRNKTNNVYPCKPQFYSIKVGFKWGSKLYRHVFVMRNKQWRKRRIRNKNKKGLPLETKRTRNHRDANKKKCNRGTAFEWSAELLWVWGGALTSFLVQKPLH